MTIGQGQQGLDAMGQALTSILKKLDDELLKIGPKSHIHHIHWFSFKETNANLRARLEAASHNRCLRRRKSPRAGEKPIKENTMTSESITFHFNRAELT